MEDNEELIRLRQWVRDLQSGMFVNCVYCGHRYGPAADTAVSMADVLKTHVEQCPEHPMAKLKLEHEQLKREHDALVAAREAARGFLVHMPSRTFREHAFTEAANSAIARIILAIAQSDCIEDMNAAGVKLRKIDDPPQG